jgi:DNA repair exonuclease SbcCD ATPase subunit
MAKQATVGELQDELKRRNERIEELRQEIDEQRELIQRLSEHAEDYSQIIESWCEAFDMEMSDDGKWTWQPWVESYNKLVDNYSGLARNWNKYLPLINREPRNVGRPIAASEAQIREVLARHRAGES